MVAKQLNMRKGDIKFTNFQHLESIPFRIYADIECFTKKITKKRGKHSKLYQEHIPSYIAAKLVCTDDQYTQSIKFLKITIALKIFSNGFFDKKSIAVKLLKIDLLKK